MKEEIIEFFQENIDSIDFHGCGGKLLSTPHFQLMADDFIEFAEIDLEGELTTRQIVNATSNLKRAVDSSLDYFMIVMNLDDFFRKKRLGVDRKLGLLSKAGLFNAKSISKLNQFRNRLEHHYEIPDIQELEVYYDLVVAFTIVMKNIIIISTSESRIELSLDGSTKNNFKSEIDFTKPEIRLTLPISEEADRKVFCAGLDTNSKNITEALLDFAFLLKLHHLLHDLDNNSISEERFFRKLKESNQPSLSTNVFE